MVEFSHKELLDLYQQSLMEIENNLDTLVFHRDAEQAEAWITFKEAFLGSDDDELGVSLVEDTRCNLLLMSS